jgi:carboxypeptidase C (cathepsin A)
MSEKTEAAPAAPAVPAAPPAPEPVDRLVTTTHTATVGGRKLEYSVTTGTMVLREESEKKGEHEGESDGHKARAEVFFTAYTLKSDGDLASRPITFTFNGGPGSSSVWLHLGAFGPRCVRTDEDGNLTPPPWRLVDNEHSLLDVTDLVFIDPVSTGYSRPLVGEKAKEFHNFKKDIESVGDFIRLYSTRYRRWSSPKFLAGESYGTTRAAGLAGHLQDRHGMYLNGIVLVSSVLEFQTLEFHAGNDLPHVVYLPAFAATAWYHRRLDPTLQKDLRATLREVEAFAQGEYATALFRGSALTAAERTAIATRVARYTGVSAAYVERTNLRLEIGRYTKELLREQRRTVGRLDSRFTGIDRDAAGERPAYDPAMAQIMGPYTATLNDYVRGELQYESDLPYEILSWKANESWKFNEHENRFVEVAETLRQTMTANPFLKVFVASGYFDLATPYSATDHTFRHLGLDPSLEANVTVAYYEAGHMMYIHRPSLEKLKADLAAFIAAASPARR